MTANALRHVLTDESGATAIEYGLMASLVSIAAMAAFFSMGSSIQEIYGEVADRLEEVNDNSGG